MEIKIAELRIPFRCLGYLLRIWLWASKLTGWYAESCCKAVTPKNAQRLSGKGEALVCRRNPSTDSMEMEHFNSGASVPALITIKFVTTGNKII